LAFYLPIYCPARQYDDVEIRWSGFTFKCFWSGQNLLQIVGMKEGFVKGNKQSEKRQKIRGFYICKFKKLGGIYCG